MRKKRFLAIVLAGTMVLGNSVAALADTVSGNLTGTGSVEGIVNPDVFSVELPTVSDDDVKDAFDFILDPQGLIEETNGARYVSANNNPSNISTNNITPGTLYFANTTSGNVTKISPSSNELTITNKGTMDVNVKVTAKAVSMDAVTLVSTNSISSGAAPSVYLALAGDDGTTKAIDAKGVALETTISGNDGAYDISWNATDGYTKTPSANATFDDYSFQLTGASGGSIKDWLKVQSKLSDAKVEVTWVVSSEQIGGDDEEETNPFNPSTLRLDTGTPEQAVVTLPDGATTITKVEYEKADGSGYNNIASGTQYLYEDGKFWFTGSFRQMMVNAGITTLECRVTFDNGETATVTLQRP